jgi:aminoglycoside N3'-acetyltransferase
MSRSIGPAAFVDHLKSSFERLPRSMVIYSASWSLARALRLSPDLIAEEFCATVVREFPSTTILMPTFTEGFDSAGVCDLDVRPAITGLIPETFRKLQQARRSRSAFFSFAIVGPERDHLVTLAPSEAWGEGSLYHWFLAADTKIVTIGVHPTHCSYSHLVEWRHRTRVPYRLNKTFRGRLRVEGQEMPWDETLFVRKRDPSPVNDFTWLLPHLQQAGMKLDTLGGVCVSSIGAAAKMAVMDRMIVEDPLAMIKNKADFRAPAL